MAIAIPKLRKKELVSKLSVAEQTELDKMIRRRVENDIDMERMQYADQVRLNALRNYGFVDTTPKVSIFQKMLSKENPTEYRIQFADETKDVATYDMDFNTAILLREVVEDVGLGLDWPKMLPVDDGMWYTDPLETYEKEWFEAFPDPIYCIGKLNEAGSLKEKAAAQGDDIFQVIGWLEKYWTAGYQIFADIDPEIED